MADDPDAFPTALAGRQLLRCDRCHQSAEVTHADLVRHMRTGWPSCCGQVMAYFVEAPHPTLPPRGGR